MDHSEHKNCCAVCQPDFVNGNSEKPEILCDSCLVFLQKGLHHDHYKSFICQHSGDCVITSRRNCDYCRFHKSVSVSGGAIFSTKNVDLASSSSLKKEEEEVVQNSALRYSSSFRTILNEDESPSGLESKHLAPLRAAMKRLTVFASLVPEFSSLPVVDQSHLLIQALLPMWVVHSAVEFTAAPSFVDDIMSPDMHRLQSSLSAFFKDKMETPDEATVALLLIVLLLSPEAPGLTKTDHIRSAQDMFRLCLDKYLILRFGQEGGGPEWKNELMNKLDDLRKLNGSSEEGLEEMNDNVITRIITRIVEDHEASLKDAEEQLHSQLIILGGDAGSVDMKNIQVMEDHRIRVEVVPDWQEFCPVTFVDFPAQFSPDDHPLNPEDILSLKELSHVQSMLEQVVKCEDRSQLQRARRILAPDLLQKVQAKLSQISDQDEGKNVSLVGIDPSLDCQQESRSHQNFR